MALSKFKVIPQTARMSVRKLEVRKKNPGTKKNGKK